MRSLSVAQAYTFIKKAEFESPDFKPQFTGKFNPRTGGATQMDFQKSDFVELPKTLSLNP